MPGQLFTHYFLTDGIRETPEWRASVADREAFASFREGVAGRYEALRRSRDPNEAVTEQDLIRPVLDLLGGTIICRSRARRATRIFPTICSLRTLHRRCRPPPAPARKTGIWMRWR